MSALPTMRRRQGDRWRWTWELTEDDLDQLDTWIQASLFAQLRAGTGRTARVLATSADDSIDFTGTNFAADPAVLQWTILAATTAAIGPGTYRLEVQVDVDDADEPLTIFSEQLTVLADSAVPA